ISQPTQVIQHAGSGPNKERQEKPHVHSVNISPNNNDVFVPDLGIDKVMAYRLNTETGELTAGNHQTVTAGSGPRHFTFHPNGKFAYVIQELTNTVTAFKYTDGKLTEIEEVTTLPKGFDGKSNCADIHISPDGKFLYGSNRFSDTIVSYKIDEATGKLTMLGQTSVEGKTPRNFTISPTGKWVLVANQDSDNIVIFSRNTETGAIAPTGKEIKVSMPVCLKWVK
ncbi:MAG: lactonase family protein, partial [Spirosomaceae bacterium]|nr:lactonase family protein [Spirosomataceae bacterium]